MSNGISSHLIPMLERSGLLCSRLEPPREVCEVQLYFGVNGGCLEDVQSFSGTLAAQSAYLETLVEDAHKLAGPPGILKTKTNCHGSSWSGLVLPISLLVRR